MARDLGIPIAAPGKAISANGWNRMREGVNQFQGLQFGFMSNGGLITRPPNAARGGNSALVLGVIVATIPAASIVVAGSAPDETVAVTHGYTATSAIITKLKTDKTGWEHEVVAGDTRKIGCVNFSFSRLRASTAHPIGALGYVETLSIADVDTEVFVPVNWDLTSLFGHNVAVVQVPYKDPASKEFKLDAEECT